MTSESHRTLLSLRLKSQASSLKPGSAAGLSLVELLIAIGILGVGMTLIGAAFPAGVAMSIAVSDETTSQMVFQKAVAEIKAQLSISGGGSGLLGTELVTMPEGDFSDISDSRKLSTNSSFSWSALVRRMAASGPMGNLCQVVIVVSRRPSGSPNFVDDGGGDSELPELRKIFCTGSDATARTLDIASGDFGMVPNGGYIIDSATGTAYIIISRNDGASEKTVTLLAEPPLDSEITATPIGGRDFWVVPGPYDGSNYGPKSPAIRVFQAMLYLP